MHILYDVICYDLKLGSDCNSDKDLSKNEGNSQLVKYKDTELYLHYIPINHEENLCLQWYNTWSKNKKSIRKQCLPHEALTDTTYSAADHYIIP